MAAAMTADLPSLGDTADHLRITRREMQIVESLIFGASARDIASDLGVSFHTIRTHIRNIYTKLGVASRVELLRRVSAIESIAPRAP